jgi:hypothetical protein
MKNSIQLLFIARAKMTSKKITVLNYFLIFCAIVDIVYLLFVAFAGSDSASKIYKISSILVLVMLILRFSLPLLLIYTVVKSEVKTLIPICILYLFAIVIQFVIIRRFYFAIKECKENWCNFDEKVYDTYYCDQCRFLLPAKYIQVTLAIFMACKRNFSII